MVPPGSCPQRQNECEQELKGKIIDAWVHHHAMSINTFSLAFLIPMILLRHDISHIGHNDIIIAIVLLDYSIGFLLYGREANAALTSPLLH